MTNATPDLETTTHSSEGGAFSTKQGLCVTSGAPEPVERDVGGSAPWSTHRYSLTKCHVSEREGIVLVAFATLTRPPWQWAVVRRSRWLDIDRNPWRLDGVAERVGGAGSWQQARKFATRFYESSSTSSTP